MWIKNRVIRVSTMITQAPQRVILFNSNNNNIYYNKEQWFASEHHHDAQTLLSAAPVVVTDTHLSFASPLQNLAVANIALVHSKQKTSNNKYESQTEEMVYFNVKTSSLHVTQGVHHNCNVWRLRCHPNERVHVSYWANKESATSTVEGEWNLILGGCQYQFTFSFD